MEPETDIFFTFYSTVAAVTREVAEPGDQTTLTVHRNANQVPHLPRVGDLVVEKAVTYRVERIVFAISDAVIYVDCVLW